MLAINGRSVLVLSAFGALFSLAGVAMEQPPQRALILESFVKVAEPSEQENNKCRLEMTFCVVEPASFFADGYVSYRLEVFSARNILEILHEFPLSVALVYVNENSTGNILVKIGSEERVLRFATERNARLARIEN